MGWHFGVRVVAVSLALVGCGDAIGLSDLDGAPRWNAELELIIGDEGQPERALTTVGSLAVSGDGTIYAALPMEAVVAVFDSAGAPVGRIGGAGDGPGEFRGLGRVGLIGDTLYALDSALSRVSYFDGEGRLVRSWRIAPPQLSEGFVPGPILALLPEATIALRLGYPGHLVHEGRISNSPILRVTEYGVVTDTLVMLSEEGRQLTIETAAGGLYYSSQPFGDAPLFGFASDGSGLVVVERRAATSTADTRFRVSWIDHRGEVQRKRSYEYRPSELSPALADSVMRATWNRFGGEAAPFALADVRRAVSQPRYLPPVRGLVVGSEGEVWLELWREGEEAKTWLMLDREGEVQGKVDLPQGFIPRFVQKDRVWGMQLDPLDVPSLVRYRLYGAVAAGREQSTPHN